MKDQFILLPSLGGRTHAIRPSSIQFIEAIDDRPDLPDPSCQLWIEVDSNTAMTCICPLGAEKIKEALENDEP